MALRRTPRTTRPTLEGLETRNLLSTAGMTMPAGMHAEGGMMNRRHQHVPFLSQLTTTPQATISTVPSNGDVNPYGVAFVPKGFARGGALSPGDVLVANFNDSQNVQGTGTTIARITPQGTTSTFFQENQADQVPGLTLALGILKAGFVVVGAVPTTGMNATPGQGSLMVLDKNGNQVLNLKDPNFLNGPWGLAVDDMGNRAFLFVSNVNTGTISRIELGLNARHDQATVLQETTIASGYAHRPDPASFVLGPAGLAFDAQTDTLYVASTLDNEIFAIPNAARTRFNEGMGRLVYQDSTHLHGPIGLAFAPNGDLLAANGDGVNADPNQNSEIVEFTPRGQFVTQLSIDSGQTAAPFGIALYTSGRTTVLAAVNDDTNQLDVFTTPHP